MNKSVYGYTESNNEFTIICNDKPVKSPNGNIVITKNMTLAEKLVSDLETYGNDPSNPGSIVAFHYPFIDFFSVNPREELEFNVSSGLDMYNDWTLICPSAEPGYFMAWMNLFGNGTEQSEKGKAWLKQLSLKQLCAVCVLGRVIESVNIPYIVATELPANEIHSFVQKISAIYQYVSAEELTLYIKNYLFYFNLDNA